MRLPTRSGLKIPLVFGTVPLTVGLSIFLFWLVTDWKWLQLIGIVTLCVGFGSVLAGFLFKGSMPWTQALFALGATVCVVSVLALVVRFSETEEQSARAEIEARLAGELATAGAMGD